MVRGAFKKYDADGSGMMTIEEVRELAKNGSAIGIEYDENDFDAQFERIDADHSGLVSEEEVWQSVKHKATPN